MTFPFNHGRLASTWWSTTPVTGPVGTSKTWVGITFSVTGPGRIAGYRRYDDAGQDGADMAMLMRDDGPYGQVLGTAPWRPRADYSGRGWHNTWQRPWTRVDGEHNYWLFVLFANGHYYRNNNAFTGGEVTRNGLTFKSGFQSTTMAPWLGVPTFNNNANAIDVFFYPD